MRIEETADRMTIVEKSTKLVFTCGAIAAIFAILAFMSLSLSGGFAGLLGFLIMGAMCLTLSRVAFANAATIEVTLDKKTGKAIWQKNNLIGAPKTHEGFLPGVRTSLQNTMIYQNRPTTAYRAVVQIAGSDCPITIRYMSRVEAHGLQNRMDAFLKTHSPPTPIESSPTWGSQTVGFRPDEHITMPEDRDANSGA
jgi:hypothetical protein